MCLSFLNTLFWNCSRTIARCIIQYNECKCNMYQYTYTINKNNDFITIYDKQRTYYVNKSNEELYIKDLGNLHDNRVNYLFPLLTVSIDDNVYALNIQKSGKYFDLVGNYINKNMIETILDIEIYEDYTINIIDKDMNHITVINQSILLEKDKYKIV